MLRTAGCDHAVDMFQGIERKTTLAQKITFLGYSEKNEQF